MNSNRLGKSHVLVRSESRFSGVVGSMLCRETDASYKVISGIFLYFLHLMLSFAQMFLAGTEETSSSMVKFVDVFAMRRNRAYFDSGRTGRRLGDCDFCFPFKKKKDHDVLIFVRAKD